MADKIKVAVIFGGRSGEHEVSLLSARSVMNALDKDKYEIIPVGITRTGEWMIGADTMGALESEDYSRMKPAAIFADPSKKGLWAAEAGVRSEANQNLANRENSTHKQANLASLSRVDVVFPVLHGTFGEDGTLQGLLELAGVPYVGAGVLSSAVAMDKITFKDVVKSHGLPVAEYLWITRKRWRAEPETFMNEVEQHLGYPVFTKPANLGSSVGIMKCHNRRELQNGIDEAARYDRRLMAEWAVPSAREIEVSVLGNEEPMASVPGEIVPKREFYDYIAKYLAEGEEVSDLIIPALLETEVTQQIQDLAVAAFKAIDGSGMARVDFLINGETDDIYLNEINTIPGFTAISMYPKLWEASGISYARLLDWLIDLALDRHQENARSERIFRPGN
jgi:D-alanine-D-alanine ligase